MKCIILKDCQLTKHSNICCFSGDHQTDYIDFKIGDKIFISEWYRGEKRRHAPRLCTLILADQKFDGTLHPDKFIDVPEDCFEIKAGINKEII